jgi:hypothetical protein
LVPPPDLREPLLELRRLDDDRDERRVLEPELPNERRRLEEVQFDEPSSSPAS